MKTNTTLFVKPSELGTIISQIYSHQIDSGKYTPLFIHGPPGVGKTSIVNQSAEKLDIKHIDIIASQMDPVDVRGLPKLGAGDVTEWTIPSYLPREKNSKGILFFDEISNSPPSVQNALLKLILDRKVENYEIPKGWIIVAAGNRASDKAHVHRLSSALSSRFIHVDLMPEIEDWSKWAANSDVHPTVVGFLNFKKGEPGILVSEKFEERAFPCPRTWEYASNLIKAGFKDKVLHTLLEGTVGQGAAIELVAYMKTVLKVSAEEVLANPLKAYIPESADQMWALVSALVPHAKTERHVPALLEYALRLANNDKEEFSLIFVRRMLQIDGTNRKFVMAKSKKDGDIWQKFIKKFGPILDNMKHEN